MPELPEIETIRINIEKYLVGAKIISIIVRNNHLRWPVSGEIYSINNKLIISVQRRSKYLLIELLEGWIIVHLGMSGSLRILFKEFPVEKHDHIDLLISNGKILRYNDPRRFGAWIWTNTLKDHKLFMNLGPEPLSSSFSSRYLYKKCKKKKISIKQLIMNNKILVGIGNIYANESLFAARIHPYRLALSISYNECETLVRVIKIILQRSIEHGGTTLRNFLQIDGNPGSFIKELQVYGRRGELCKVCSSPILASKHAQRTTYFCNNCQK